MKINYDLEIKKRLDQFLSSEIDSLSREKIKNHIKTNLVSIDNKIINKPSYELIGNGIINIEIKETIEYNNDLKPWEGNGMPKIIFECDDYLIINKPSGLTVHPGIGNQDKTLVNILIHNKIDLSYLDTNRPGIVHRIDKNTSGVMIISKNNKFHNFISEQFQKGEVEKIYILISENKYKDQKGIIEVPIGRNHKNRKLMKGQLENSKYAKSIYRVMESFKNNEYVEFKILTGRTHQIRVHSKFIGSPVLNDIEYGKNIFDYSFGQFLHAEKISFYDFDGNKVKYESIPPEKFNVKLKELREQKVV